MSNYKKVLFVDRDGTLVIEPAVDLQVDSLEKLEFYPGVFQWLARIVKEFDYELIMVTNQDGLGTEAFPEDTFWPAQEKMIKAFQNEGIHFSDVLIDKTLPEEKANTRKPNTGLLSKYVYGNYDLNKSFVIGDRLTDIQLAENLGAKGILLSESKHSSAELVTSSWEAIYKFLKNQERKSLICRKTKETDVRIELNLDGAGIACIDTGLSFFDHMLEQISKHGQFDLDIQVNGDLNVDEHHTIEDVGLALGAAYAEALGSKKGIERYGFLLPMDDSLAQVALDFGGRPFLVWNCQFRRERIGDMPTEMFKHFFKSFTDTSMSNLNIKVEGENEHHKIECIFKAFGKCLKMAVSKNDYFTVPSTKGLL